MIMNKLLRFQKWLLIFFSISYAGIANAEENRSYMDMSIAEFGESLSQFELANGTPEIIGVNYPAVIKKALQEEKRSMALVIWLSANAGFDTSAAPQNDMILYYLLHHKKELFVSALKDADKETQREVIWNLKWWHESENGDLMSMAEFLNDFPELRGLNEDRQEELNYKDMSVSEFSEALSHFEHANATLEKMGVDYPAVIKSALQGKKRSISLAIWLSASAGFDTSSGAQNQIILYYLMHQKKELFVSALNEADKPSQRAVITYLKWYHEVEKGGAPISMEAFLNDFPDLRKLNEGKQKE